MEAAVIESLIVNAGILGVALIVVAALAYKLATHFFSKSIDKHFEQELLTFKNELRTDAFIRETRWQRLDDKRLKVCLELNTLLFKAARAMDRWTGPFMQVPRDEEERKRELQRRAEVAADSINALNEFLRCHSFLLPATVYDLLDDGVRELRETFHKSDIWKVSSGDSGGRDVEGRHKASVEVWTTISHRIPKVQDMLRQEFGRLLDPSSIRSAKALDPASTDESR